MPDPQSPPSNPGSGWGVHNPDVQAPPADPGNGWAVLRTPVQPPPDDPGSGWSVSTFYIAGISPTFGPTSTGTTVTITGVGFTDVDLVLFTGLPGFPTEAAATSVVVVSDTEITCVSPDTVTVAVVSSIRLSKPGPSFTTLTTPDTPADDFRFVAPFTVLSRTPGAGPPEGGQTVTITGTGFTGINLATAVTIDGITHPVIGTPTDTELQVVTQPHIAALVDLEVTYGATTLLVGTYRYIAAPTIISAENTTEPGNAARSPIAGSGSTQVITITGTGFTDTSYIRFHPIGSPSYVGATINTGFTETDTTLTMRAPVALASINIEILVVNANGLTAIPATVGADSWRFYAPLTVTDCTPDFGPKAGGTEVVIEGTGFYGATTVEFDGIPCPAFTVDDDEHITATTPPHPAFAHVQIGVETDLE